jgi:hypothetical protein
MRRSDETLQAVLDKLIRRIPYNDTVTAAWRLIVSKALEQPVATRPGPQNGWARRSLACHAGSSSWGFGATNSRGCFRDTAAERAPRWWLLFRTSLAVSCIVRRPVKQQLINARAVCDFAGALLRKIRDLREENGALSGQFGTVHCPTGGLTL